MPDDRPVPPACSTASRPCSARPACCPRRRPRAAPDRLARALPRQRRPACCARRAPPNSPTRCASAPPPAPPLVPQGGNTSMVGGATPDESGRQIPVSLARLNRVRDIDPVDMTMTAEAGRGGEGGAGRGGRRRAACSRSRFGAEGSATVGGVLSTNAGGNTTVRYGNARDLMLGLEVVLPDGQVWNGLRRLRKDNTGYALRHLFVGAEGTLGFITAAVLRLFPRPRESEVAFCAVAQRGRGAVPVPPLPRPRRERGARLRVHVGRRRGPRPSRTSPARRCRVETRADHYALVDLASSRPDAGLREHDRGGAGGGAGGGGGARRRDRRQRGAARRPLAHPRGAPGGAARWPAPR